MSEVEHERGQDMTHPATLSGAGDSPEPGAKRARRRHSRLLSVLGLVLVAAAAIVLVLVLNDNDDDAGGTPDASDQATSTEAERPDIRGVTSAFSGAGDDATETFQVPDNWEIAWETSGSSFELELYTADDVSRGVVVSATDDSEGSTFVVEEGTFYLQVSTDGDWTIDIIGRLD